MPCAADLFKIVSPGLVLFIYLFPGTLHRVRGFRFRQIGTSFCAWVEETLKVAYRVWRFL